jgi:hypothetical protein
MNKMKYTVQYKSSTDVRRREKRNLRIAGYTQSLMIAAGSIVMQICFNQYTGTYQQ